VAGSICQALPPNAEMGSARTAARYASRRSPPHPLAEATPHGLVCFTTTKQGPAEMVDVILNLNPRLSGSPCHAGLKLV
jgi:hypothetical protein